MIRRLTALAFLLCATGVLAQQTVKPPEPAKKPADPAAKPTEPAKKPTEPAKTPPSPQELLKTADELVKQVAALRQLTVRAPVKRGVLNREAIKARLRTQIKRQYTSREIQIEGGVLKALGLLPPDLDYEKLQLDLLMEQVAGFYDPWGKQLYIADWLPTEMQPPALAHEIAHALQDQHFDLKKFVTPVHDQGDRQLARSALVEGDGTGVMIEFASHKDLSAMPDMSKMMDLLSSTGALSLGPAGPMPVLEKAPAFIKQSLLFPYVSGLGFVQYVRKRYPWAKLDEAYRRPPESTEQIIHPEKFFAREHPVWIKAAPLAAMKSAGAKMVHEDTFGELQTRLFLSIVGGAAGASDAAAGWGGDRMVAYEPSGGGPYQVVWLTQWDTEADASEFANAAKPAIEKLSAWASEPRGKQVLVLIGIAPESCQKVADQVFKSWKPTTAPPQ
ncbi:MAG TPA: hypothetical protein VKN99_25865 [Polyangia bacterium]|nr:hypothetical protein [Polyangia bacterium]